MDIFLEMCKTESERNRKYEQAMKTKTETVFKTVMKSPRSDGFMGEFSQYYRAAAIQTVLC